MTESINPRGAFRRIPDFRFPVDVEGEFAFMPANVETFRCNATVVRGACLAFVAATPSTQLSVRHMTSADNSTTLFAGVALEGGVAGQTIRVVTSGHAIVFCGNISIDLGWVLVKPAGTPGKFEATNTIDATTVTGTILGRALGGTDSTLTFAHCWIGQF